MSAERPLPEFLVIGEILKPHGIRGELRMRVLTENRHYLPRLETVCLGESPADERPQTRVLLNLRFNKHVALLKLEGVASRNDAEALRGKTVLIRREQAPPLDEGEYYLFQIIGLRVHSDGADIGEIKEVLQTGANDVYVVEGKHGEALVPAHAETIDSIDFDAGVVRMSLPDGLLPAD